MSFRSPPLPPPPSLLLVHSVPSATDFTRCRSMYKFGFFLPLLWLVNFAVYRQCLRFDDTPKQMKKCKICFLKKKQKFRHT